MVARQTVVDAHDPDEAISRYVRESEAELVSFARSARGGSESIATVKREDALYLVRVYAD